MDARKQADGNGRHKKKGTAPDLFEEVVRLRREGIPAALATIVGTRGSTPGREAMRLLVTGDGTFLGTVGGGCLEAEVYETALEVLADEQPRTLEFRLTEHDSPDSGLLCGGEVTVFVEPITTPALWIFGGGHVSKALCQVAALAGFRVTVCDDRASYASGERFPEATEALVGPFSELVEDMPLRANTYVVVVTRGHKEDGVVLEALARRWQSKERPRFLGMIGSKTKRAVLFRHLRAAEGGVPEDFLQAIRSPVGLYIGARSHEEIAVSVVGELVSVRRTGQDGAAAWKDRKARKALEATAAAGGTGDVPEGTVPGEDLPAEDLPAEQDGIQSPAPDDVPDATSAPEHRG